MATKPIILTVDDDTQVLQAIARDVRHGFGEHFRVIRAESGQRALDVLERLRVADETVALMLVDQRMPGMSGLELLTAARRLFPEAKRALLTAYADTDAAITAINEVRLDHYLVKPWDPPEQRLFPMLDEMLDDWLADHPPEYRGIRVIGHRWSQESHAVREFLARNLVPYRWIDLDSDAEAPELLRLTGGADRDFPLLLFPDGAVLERPTTQEVAEKASLRGRAEVPLYDLIVVGAGPAGLAAAVYGASEGLRTLIIERDAAGGQAGQSSRIENYLGFPSGLSGADLARRATAQARRFGAEFLLTDEVVAIDGHAGVIGVSLGNGTELRAHSVVVATGVDYRRLDVPGADRLTGRGVYYGAAVSETSSVRGEVVHLVGAANSAGQAALHFAAAAERVTILVRGADLSASMSHYLVQRIAATPNIEVRYSTAVEEVRGRDRLEEIVLRDTADGHLTTEPANALFVLIGAVPRTDWLDGGIARDDRGFVLSGPTVRRAGAGRSWPLERDPYLMETNVPGVFAAGDVRLGSGKRVATAVGEGATAVMSVWQYRAGTGL
ncbi:FAD-dependent oxidoreductase [Georgenia subflava]|uniref:Response regulator n=1 Tax=Georgenia subflava TaxID=1622177 RepID=A0A6N7EJN6_9MICO|nr:FAD-dependent oxidoreductase [Georgenia subflava]MPV37263.1 response regulator [Georgenia subflava]